MVENETRAAPTSLTELFKLDHRRLDAILAAAKQSLHAGDIAGCIARFSEFRGGLERHIVAEEEIVFPVLEALTGRGTGPTQVMRLEHQELRRLLAETTSRLERSGSEGVMTPLASLTARIYAHNGKEERILYPAIDRAARAGDTLEGLLRRARASGL